MRMKLTVAPERLRKRVSSPTEKMPMAGQKSISKAAKTLRRFTRPLRTEKAQIFLAEN